MNSTQAKQLKIEDILEKMGVFAEKKAKNQLMYKAFYRDDQHNSLSVNTYLDIWFDHGLGKGGNVIELVMLIFNLNFSEALQKLSELNNKPILKPLTNKVNINSDNSNSIEIQNIETLSNFRLCNYIVNERKVKLDLVKRFAKQLTYKNGDKEFLGIGIPTIENGWEIASIAGFKTSTKPKSISVFKFGFSEIFITEGMFDAFSFFIHNPAIANKCDVLIMNTVSLKDKALDYLLNSTYSKHHLILDNDKSGKDCNSGFLSWGQSLGRSMVDHSPSYSGSKDLNDHIRGIKMDKNKNRDNEPPIEPSVIPKRPVPDLPPRKPKMGMSM